MALTSPFWEEVLATRRGHIEVLLRTGKLAPTARITCQTRESPSWTCGPVAPSDGPAPASICLEGHEGTQQKPPS